MLSKCMFLRVTSTISFNTLKDRVLVKLFNRDIKTKLFFSTDENNSMIANVVRKRNREVSLVVSTKYNVMATHKEMIVVLGNEMFKKRNIYKHVAIKLEEVDDFKEKDISE